MGMIGIRGRLSIGLLLGVSILTVASCSSGHPQELTLRGGAASGGAGKAPAAQLPSQPVSQAPDEPALPAVITQNGQAVTAARLISQGLGWAMTPAGLFVTGDAGQSWRGWPLPTPASAVFDVALLSPSQALVASDGAEGVIVSATGDNGHTWRSSDLGGTSRGAAAAEFAYRGQRVAGLLVTKTSSSNFSLADWYATTDGASWIRHDAPTGGGVTVAGDATLWLAGGPLRDQLFNSIDGGASWTPVSLPSELAAGSFAIDPPTVRPDGLAVLTVSVSTGETTEVVVLTTTDRGRHWTEAGRAQLADSIGSGVTVASSLGTGQVLIAAPNGSAVVAIPVAGGQPRRLSATNSLKGAAGISLASDQVGWARTTSTVCADKTNCTSTADLLVTRDGGATWQRAIPR